MKMINFAAKRTEVKWDGTFHGWSKTATSATGKATWFYTLAEATAYNSVSGCVNGPIETTDKPEAGTVLGSLSKPWKY